MKRIMIYGGSGAGKSTLAREIGAATGLPIIHIDPMYYTAGWVPRPKKETKALVQNAMAREKWVFDGNHHGTFDERIRRADVIIFLDLPTWLRLWRVLVRIKTYRGQTRPDMAQDCPERFDSDFFFRWVMGYYWRSHKNDVDIFNSILPEKMSFRLRSTRQVKSFLAALPAQFGPGQ